MNARFDVAIVGGGPGGLQAALTLGRARKKVALFDAGPRRNAAAKGVNNFVTRDGIAPEEFRREARAQLAKYPNVELLSVGVERVSGERDAFSLGGVSARRVLLATGMIDVPPAIEGLAPLWGHSVFQCPYCHGWEIRGKKWGYVMPEHAAPHVGMFVKQLYGWTEDVMVFPQREVKRLVGSGEQLVAVELTDGRRVACDALFMHPPQKQVPVVSALGLALDEEGFVKVDPMLRETSMRGVYAAGDLTTRLQAAVIAAAAGMQAAAIINADLSGAFS